MPQALKVHRSGFSPASYVVPGRWLWETDRFQTDAGRINAWAEQRVPDLRATSYNKPKYSAWVEIDWKSWALRTALGTVAAFFGVAALAKAFQTRRAELLSAIAESYRADV